MGLIFYMHKDLLEQEPVEGQPTNGLYHEWIKTTQLANRWYNANEPRYTFMPSGQTLTRTELQRMLKNSGGTIPPADQRPDMIIKPSDVRDDLSNNELQTFLNYNTVYLLTSDILNWQRALKLTLAQYQLQVPFYVPNSVVLDDEGQSTGVQMTWDQWQRPSHPHVQGTDGNWYINSNSNVTGDDWLAGSILFQLQLDGAIQSAINPNNIPRPEDV